MLSFFKIKSTALDTAIFDYWLPEQTHTDVEAHRSATITPKDAAVLSATKQAHTVLVSVSIFLSVVVHRTWVAIILSGLAFWISELIETM
eukprot:SAG25_NODE_2749_length_1405_cov_1.271057_1_plen_90_part_00